jgi:hypothetical protein
VSGLANEKDRGAKPNKMYANKESYIVKKIKCIYVSEFLSTDPEVPGSIPGATRFSEKQWVWNGVHLAS